jgi:hypothetical protein
MVLLKSLGTSLSTIIHRISLSFHQKPSNMSSIQVYSKTPQTNRINAFSFSGSPYVDPHPKSTEFQIIVMKQLSSINETTTATKIKRRIVLIESHGNSRKMLKKEYIKKHKIKKNDLRNRTNHATPETNVSSDSEMLLVKNGSIPSSKTSFSWLLPLGKDVADAGHNMEHGDDNENHTITNITMEQQVPQNVSIFSMHNCCEAIVNAYSELCTYDDSDDEKSFDARFFIFLFVMALCGVVKSLIRHFRIVWLPEAAGCILVGGTYYIKHFVSMLGFGFVSRTVIVL